MEAFECPEKGCGRKFPSLQELELHKKRRHGIETKTQEPEPLSYKELFLNNSDAEKIEEARKIDLSDMQLQLFEPHIELPLEWLRGLRELDLQSNSLVDINALQFFVGLKELNISDNRIDNIWPLEDCKKLKRLLASNNQIGEIGVVEELKELKQLILFGNQLISGDYSFQILSKLKKLKSLGLAGNPCVEEPGFNEKIMAFLPITRYNDEKISEKEREQIKTICFNLHIYDETRAQTAPAIRVRTIKGASTEARKLPNSPLSKKTEKNDTYAKQEALRKRIQQLETENSKLRAQLDSDKSLEYIEKQYEFITKKCMEFEEENILLRKRLALYNGEIIEPSNLVPEPPALPQNPSTLSDSESEESDEELKKTITKNKEKMHALQKELQLLFSKINPEIPWSLAQGEQQIISQKENSLTLLTQTLSRNSKNSSKINQRKTNETRRI